MKRIIVLIAIIASSISMSAQTKSVNLELLGANGLAGISFDARFKGNYGFGYSVGLGYGFSSTNIDFAETAGRDGVNHQAVVPVELNYLFGKHNSHFVLGAGLVGGVVINEAVKKPSFGGTAFADIAYRYQKPKGFNFSIGMKPNLQNALYPYLSVGFSF